jgi:hypothetical protein
MATRPIEAFTYWLTLITQHRGTVSRLLKSLKIPLCVTVLEPPKTKQEKSQASLDDLLVYVLDGKDDIKKFKTFLWDLARYKISSEPEKKIGWDRLTKNVWRKWELYFSGKHPCELMFVCLNSLKFENIRSLVKSQNANEFKQLVRDLQVKAPISVHRTTSSWHLDAELLASSKWPEKVLLPV